MSMTYSPDRRLFLRRAAAAWPALHAGALLCMTAQSNANEPGGPTRARFAALRMRTHCIDDMMKFYRETLELPAAQAGNALKVTAGETVLEFTPAEAESRPYYHFAFNIPHNTLDAAIKWIQPRVPLIKRADGSVVFHFPAWDAHAIYFLDPAGNIVEFIARHTLKNDAADAESFGPKDLLCASEIGVVAPDVTQAAEKLGAAAGVERYHGGDEQFAAMGDEHGLFIVVKTGRRWFSSDRHAEVFPAEAVARGVREGAPMPLADSRFQLNVVN